MTVTAERAARAGVAASRLRTGTLAALGSALAYGSTVVIGRSLARDGLDGAPVLTCRFGLSALLLVGFQLWRGSVAPPPGERLRTFGLGVLYAGQARVFFAALGRGSAGAVALVFYSYPAMVALAELARRTTRWSARLGGALALSVGGVVTVVAVEGDLFISATGVLFALGSAALFTTYLLAGDSLLDATDAVVKAAWISGGAALTLAAVALGSGGDWPGLDRAPLLLGYGVANAAAFGLMFVALPRIGPTRTAVMLNFEVVSSVGLAAVVLDERFAPLQAIGGLGVVVGAILAATTQD